MNTKNEVALPLFEAVQDFFMLNIDEDRPLKEFGVDYKNLPQEHKNGLGCILYEGKREWQNTPCDEEPTPEQDAALEDIVENTAQDILKYLEGKGIITIEKGSEGKNTVHHSQGY